MSRLLALGAGIFVFATLVPAAWPQEAPAPEAPAAPAAPAAPVDPMAQALGVIKSATVPRIADLQEARNYLVDQRQVSRPLIVQLLGDSDAQVRMNAAIVLSEMASAGDTSAATVQALETAAKDRDFAVAYWGFQGLMSDGVPAADQRTVIADMMKPEIPRALRLAALTTLDDKKPTAAAPIIVSHLQEILKEYKEQVETLVTSAATIKRVTPTPGVGPATGGPGPMYQPTGPTYPPAGGQPGGTGTGVPGRFTPPPRTDFTMMRGGRGGMGGGGMPGRPVTPATPVTPTPSEGLRPSGPVQQVRRMDLPDMTLDQLSALAHGVEALPIVAEMHQMGMVLEDIVGNASPEAPVFDFKTTPPWDLDKCVDKAVIYMNSHGAQFGAAPAAPAAPATAAPPAALPATAPAPATTPAPPAGGPATPSATPAAPAATAATPAVTTPAP